MSSKKISRSDTPTSGVGERIKALRGERTQAAFAKLLGMKATQLIKYEQGRVPDPMVLLRLADAGHKTVDWILRGDAVAGVTGHDRAATYDVVPPRPDWLNPEWQERRAFTAMVQALKELDRIPPQSLSAWRARVAWEAVIGASRVIRGVAGWDDSQDVGPRPGRWRKIFEGPIDHWKVAKFGRRTEAETLKERLQIELGFDLEAE